MNQVFLSDSVWLHFGTSSTSTGAATNADSTPTVTVAEDGTNMGYSPTVSNVATGLYKVQIDATAGNGFESGKRYSVYVTATVGGITGRDGIGEFEVLAVDLNTGVASVTGAVASVTAAVTLPTIPTDWITASGIAAGAITSSEAPALANLDVAVSTRLATSGYTAPSNSTIATILKILKNKTVTDPSTGAMTVYDDDDTTPLFTCLIWENVAGTQAYRSQGVERRDRLA